MNRPGAIDYALLVLLAGVWGSSFAFIKLAVDTIPPATLTLVRLWIAAGVLVPVAAMAARSWPKTVRTWALVALAGLFGNALPFTLISWGEQRIDSGLAAILMGAMPLYTLVLAHFFAGNEPITGPRLVGVVLGLAGLLVLVGPSALRGLGGDLLHQLAVAGAALCYAVNAIIAKRLIALPRWFLAAGNLFMAAVMMIPVAFAWNAPLAVSAPMTAWGAVIALGVVHTAVATFIMLALISRQGASFFSQINFLVPLFGVAWGAALLGEIPGANAVAALALILAGIAFAYRYKAGPRPTTG